MESYLEFNWNTVGGALIFIVAFLVIAGENWRAHHGSVCFDLSVGKVFFSKDLDLGKPGKIYSIGNIESLIINRDDAFLYRGSYELSMKIKNTETIQKFPFIILDKEDAIKITQQTSEFANIPVFDWNNKQKFSS